MTTGWPYIPGIPQDRTYYESGMSKHENWEENRTTLEKHGFTRKETIHGTPGIWTVSIVTWEPPPNYGWHLLLYWLRLKKLP